MQRPAPHKVFGGSTMTLAEGLYKVSFQTALGIGFGVAVLRDGVLQGGDSSMYYVGRYAVDGQTIEAQVHVDVHSSVPGMESVLGSSEATLVLSGSLTKDGARFTGSAREAPGLGFRASMTKLV